MGLFWTGTASDCYSSISVNTGLGLSFYRVVSEEGSNGWAQVFARVPFDDSELMDKGALFGVVSGKDKDRWVETEEKLMAWVEEYFNKSEKKGDLAAFFDKWQEEYPGLTGGWIWVVEEDGHREVVMAGTDKVEISLLRKEKEFNFSSGLVGGRAARGRVTEGDRVALWTEGLLEGDEEASLLRMKEEGITHLNDRLKNDGLAAAGLVLDFLQFDKPADEEVPEERVAVVVREAPILADEKLVGPLGIKEKVSNWWMEVSRKLTSVSRRGSSVERRENPKRKKMAVGLGVVFLILLLISLISGSIKMRNEAESKIWKEFVEPIEKSLSEAVGLAPLNPSGARKLIQDSRDSYESKKSEFAKGKHSQDLVELGLKIEESWTLVSGEKESEVEEVARIDLVRQGFGGNRMSLVKSGQLVVMDERMGVVVTVELMTKDIKVAAGKGEGLGWLDVVGDTKKIMTLSSSGVRNAQTGQDLVKFDAAVVRPIAMERFGDNLYILDQGNKEIFKYAAGGEGFGERARWLKQDQSMEITPVDMAIDSDIWVVSEDGQMERFRRGSKEQFGLSGLSSGLKIVRVAVELEGDRVALLDSTSGAVAICSKTTGACSQLLKSEKLREAKDLEFDETGKLLILLPGVVGVLK